MTKQVKYEVGDLVRHTRNFLQSTSWYTNVPKDGKVTEVGEYGSIVILSVEWCDGESSRINAVNVEKVKRKG